MLVLAPVVAIRFWVESVSKLATMALLVPFACIHMGYFLFYEGRYGQTIGKRLMRIRIVKRNGDAIGWREACLRNSVTILFAAIHTVTLFIALIAIADHDFYNVGWTVRTQNLFALRPASLTWSDTVGEIWTWSEVIVMLSNRERRALHDFIAGTVVIKSPNSPYPLIS
jgi:uncharacterized RDD family membrane protein YckC